MSDPICHVDVETFSECDLKKAGAYVYAEHESTILLCVAYAFGNGPVKLWIVEEEGTVPDEAWPRRADEVYVGLECPYDLAEHARQGRIFYAHNAAFERVIFRGVAGRAVGFPKTELRQWKCTMAMAANAAIPRGLKDAAKAMKTHRKDETGRGMMMQLVKPRRPSKAQPETRWMIHFAPEKFRALYDYNVDDVHAERELAHALPELSAREQQMYWMDQVINDRGVRVDRAAVEDAIDLVDQRRARLEEKCVELTGARPTQTKLVADWVRDQGYEIENLQKATVAEALEDPGCPGPVRRLLKIRNTHAMKAVAKYDAMIRAMDPVDDAVRGMFVYYGANTGRWSSRIVQLQNLFRPLIEAEDVETAIAAFRERDLEWLVDLYGLEPMKILASCVRGMLIAREGKILRVADYSSIEGRVLAWLAGQLDKLEVFRTHGLIYEYTAAKIHRLDHTDLGLLKRMKKENPDARFEGKTSELALGYQGGVGALSRMARNYGVDLDDERADGIKVEWRAANKRIVAFWYALEEAARAAVAHPGRAFACGHEDRIKFCWKGRWLHCRLPSGRMLRYLDPSINSYGQVEYFGMDTYTRVWCRVPTYGGRLAENVTQAVSRDIMANGMVTLHKAGYDLIGSVHDEVLSETDEDFGSTAEMEELMCQLPEWADGLPVAAEGFSGHRYRK